MWESLTFLLLGIIIGAVIGLTASFFLYRLFKGAIDQELEDQHFAYMELFKSQEEIPEKEIEEEFPEPIFTFKPFSPQMSDFPEERFEVGEDAAKLADNSNFTDFIDEQIERMARLDKYDEVIKLQGTKNNSENWFKGRKEWFKERVKKRVYISTQCPCIACQNLAKDGVEIPNEKYANDLFGLENMWRIIGKNNHFIDKK